MARPRKRWSHSVGRYGARVRIYEPRLAAPLRWDYREGDKRKRPEVEPALQVRKRESDPVDPIAERRAIKLCEQKAAALTLEPLRKATEPERLTVGAAYKLFFHPRKKALPKSREARIHHTSSRKFWEHELGIDTPWDVIAPADVKAALLRVIEAGHTPTAEKRLANLRTLYRWLVEMQGYDQLRNPTRGIDKRELFAAHVPKRPRYTAREVEALVSNAPAFGPRFGLFVALLADSGARAVQVRHAMRSGLNCELEPPPPAGMFPHGWLQLPAVKGQHAMLTALTHRQKIEMRLALETYLAPWEKEFQETGTDYPLIPGGREDQPIRQPISDEALREMWAELEAMAEIPRKARRAFHGSRRSWSDDIYEGEGLDTLTAAGGWSNSRTPESTYLSRAKYSHVERARQRREKD